MCAIVHLRSLPALLPRFDSGAATPAAAMFWLLLLQAAAQQGASSHAVFIMQSGAPGSEGVA